MSRKFSRWATPGQLSSRLPTLLIPAAKAFPEHWKALPTHGKVLSALAFAAGLEVTHSDDPTKPRFGEAMRGWLWAGTAESFRSSELFKASTNWSFQEWGATESGEGLRCNMMRIDGLIYARVIFRSIGRRSCHRFIAMADADGGYQAFRRRMLSPVNPQDEEADHE